MPRSWSSALPPPWIYVATGRGGSMPRWRSASRSHRARRGPSWTTVEAPRDLAAALAARASAPVLVDCLTLWLSNLHAGGCRRRRGDRTPRRCAGTSRRAGRAGRQRGRLRHRARQRAGAALSRSAGAAQPADRGARRPRRPDRRRTAAHREGKCHDRNRSTRPKPSAIAPRWPSARRCRTPRSPARPSRRACSSSTPAPARANPRRPSGSRCACSAAAIGSASCSSSRAPGTPASATRFAAFGDQVVWHTMGEGFTWETQDLKRDIAAAERAWAKALELMADPTLRPRRARRAQHRAALRLSRPRRGRRGADGAPRAACTSSSPAATPSRS